MQNVLSFGSMVKAVSDIFASPAPMGEGEETLRNFLESSKENISLQIHYQPPRPFFPDSATIAVKAE